MYGHVATFHVLVVTYRSTLMISYATLIHTLPEANVLDWDTDGSCSFVPGLAITMILTLFPNDLGHVSLTFQVATFFSTLTDCEA